MGNISHFCINCAPSEFDEVLSFYLAALKPIGYKEKMRPVKNVAGLANGSAPDFWISENKTCAKVSREDRREMGLHFAFVGKGE
jgi:hypothetical protein